MARNCVHLGPTPTKARNVAISKGVSPARLQEVGWRRSAGLRRTSVRLFLLVASILATLALPARADVILDPREVAMMLAEIGKHKKTWQTAPTPAVRNEALYEMGETAFRLAQLMSADKVGHGAADPNLTAQIQRRLKDLAVVVVEDKEGFHYDMAAFREYLRRAPGGERAADARLVMLGDKEAPEDTTALKKSIEQKHQFVRAYPSYVALSLVKYWIARDQLRLSRLYSKQGQTSLSDRHRKQAEDAYRDIVKNHPDSQEAKAAGDYLKQVAAQ